MQQTGSGEYFQRIFAQDKRKSKARCSLNSPAKANQHQ
jgi:hypothetical protein